MWLGVEGREAERGCRQQTLDGLERVPRSHSQLLHSSLGATDADSGSAVCKAWPNVPDNHATGTRADTVDWG